MTNIIQFPPPPGDRLLESADSAHERLIRYTHTLACVAEFEWTDLTNCEMRALHAGIGELLKPVAPHDLTLKKTPSD